MTDSIIRSQTDLKDRLRRFQEDLNRDFEHRDVLDNLRFQKEDLMWIQAPQNKSVEVIDRLIFYYIYKKKDLSPFLKALEGPYNWIYKKILSTAPDKWISDYRRAIQDIPINQDMNVYRTEDLWEIQKSLKELTSGHYLILFGKLGFGKRWLAADACRDYSVISKMNFKIYWLNVGKCNTSEQILDKLHRLKILLNIDDLDIKYTPYSGNAKNEIIHMRTHLRKVLEKEEYKNCLIVLTDVQDENIIKAFSFNCKILLTTRHWEKLEFIPSDRRKIIEIKKGFTHSECNELFMKALETNKNLPDYMADFQYDVFNKCSGHPSMMARIAKTFHNPNETDEKRRKRCEAWLKNLDQYDVHDSYKQIKMSMDESVKFLGPDELENYKKLVIFSDNIEVPLEVLSKLWDADLQKTELLVDKLHKYSLIEKQMNSMCSLHYVHYKYLKEEVSEEKQCEYHQLILDKYEVEKTYRNRTELEPGFPDDNYFHLYIGNHLIGANKIDLFDMYLDFGFLEEKIRIAKITNTFGDLLKFTEQIHRNDKYKKRLLEAIGTFLLYIEQLLYKSRDTTLLQYALTNEGLVKDEAQRQAAKFQDRVWMDDINHLRNEDQIVELKDGFQPKIVRFVRPNDLTDLVCLVSLHDNNILLHDIEPNYVNKPTLFKNDLPHNTIIDMQIFRHQAFLVLNDVGKLSVYNLKSNKTRRPSAPTKLNTELSTDLHPFVMENSSDKFICFSIVDQPNSHSVDLIVGTTKERLKLYTWLPTLKKFEDKKMSINTGFKDLFRIAYINDYVMLLNRNGKLKFIDLVDGKTLSTSIDLQKLDLAHPVSLHQGICSTSMKPITICVSSDRVIQITHIGKLKNFINIQQDDIFMAKNEFDNNKILSSAVTKDFLYIVLGTAKGIIVIDRNEKTIVSRRSVSEQVISLDVFRYPGEKMYLFISVYEDAGQIVNLHSFMHPRDNEITMHYLKGEDAFDIYKSDESDDWSLVGVDNRNSIHYRSSRDDFGVTDGIKFDFEIRKICYQNENEIIVGCTNGQVYKIDSIDNQELLTQLTGEITYLEKIGHDVIVSSNCSYALLDSEILPGKVTKAYRYDKDTLLVIKKDCSIEFFDLETKSIKEVYRLLDEDRTCIAQAYCNSLLAIGTVTNDIFLWNVNDILDGNNEKRSIQNQLDVDITYMTISPDKNILAVGCNNGNVEIFDLTQLIPIATLESHKRPIMNLVFSPWLENEGPLILLSLSESINFWNITHIQNNRTSFQRIKPQTIARVSQRFKSPLKIFSSSDNILDIPFNGLKLNEKHWSNKTGPHDKRELLSCIKFIGKSAKKVVVNDDFTRFVTIDNEGKIYHLRLIDQLNRQEIIDLNGNTTTKNNYE